LANLYKGFGSEEVSQHPPQKGGRRKLFKPKGGKKCAVAKYDPQKQGLLQMGLS